MKRDVVFARTVALMLVLGGVQGGGTSELMVGIVPSDGTTLFVKRFPVAAGTAIDGVTFRNNDPRTVFPEVLLVRGVDVALADGAVVARSADVRETSPGTVQVSWDRPVQVSEAMDYYVAVRIPSGLGKQGRGNGPAVEATEVATPSGSFVAGGPDGTLTAVRLDLAMSLVTGAVGKASVPNPQEESNPSPQTFLGTAASPQTSGIVTIRFGVERKSHVVLDVYNVAGRCVRRLLSGSLDPGVYAREWDGNDADGRSVAAGVYIARLRLGDQTLTRKLVLTK